MPLESFQVSILEVEDAHNCPNNGLEQHKVLRAVRVDQLHIVTSSNFSDTEQSGRVPSLSGFLLWIYALAADVALDAVVIPTLGY